LPAGDAELRVGNGVILPGHRKGDAGAGRRNRRETGISEEPGAAGIPGVRHDEAAVLVVQGEEVCAAVHGFLPCSRRGKKTLVGTIRQIYGFYTLNKKNR